MSESATVTLPQAMRLTGYGRDALLAAWHEGNIDGHVQWTRGGHVYAYRLNRASVLRWLDAQDQLARQRRAMGGA